MNEEKRKRYFNPIVDPRGLAKSGHRPESEPATHIPALSRARATGERGNGVYSRLSRPGGF